MLSYVVGCVHQDRLQWLSVARGVTSDDKDMAFDIKRYDLRDQNT